MIETISQVIDNHICTNCGTCAGICPSHALEMTETPDGQILPYLDDTKCTDCGICHKVCPQINVPIQMKEYLADPCIGPIRSAYLGETCSATIASEGQTGGLARTLLASILRLGLADMVICVADNHQSPLRPHAILTRIPERVLKASRSKYCPIPLNNLISEILKCDDRIAICGLGCHIQGLQLAIEQIPKLRDRIVFKLGLFCDRVLKYTAIDYFLRCAGVPAQEVVAFDYRHKAWLGWPGDIRITTRNGDVHNVSRYQRVDSRELFTPIHCRLCIDKLNILSDISLGDPYGLAQGKQVPTAAIVRTKVGECILAEVQKAGDVILKPADPDVIIKNQNMAIRVGNCITFSREMIRRGYFLPQFLQSGALAVKRNRSRPLRVRSSVKFTLFFSTTTGVQVLRRVARIVVVFWKRPLRWFKVYRYKFRSALNKIFNSK